MSRYRSSVLGPARLFFNRLPMLAGYTVVFEAREGVTRARPISLVVLFVGQIIHGLFAEFANRTPASLANVIQGGRSGRFAQV